MGPRVLCGAMAGTNRHVRARRSELTTPASSARMIESAAGKSAADVVIVDLEDATAQGEKASAREVVRKTVPGLDWGDKGLALRTNAVGSRWFDGDMREVVPAVIARLDALVLPKVESPEDLVEADRLLARFEEEAGRPVGSVALEALVESPRAVVDLEEIASASERLEALIFGVADYAALAGARLGDDVFTDFVYAKQRLVAVARAFDIAPIDCVTFRYRDLQSTRLDADRAARMGFEGKWCVHPAQVPVVNDAFTPSGKEVRWARKVVEGLKEGELEGRGAVVVGGEMVDRATLRVAERVLALAERARVQEGSE